MMTRSSAGPSTRDMVKSVVLHVLTLCIVLLLPARALGRSVVPEEIDVVFHRPPQIEVPAPVPLPPPRSAAPGPLAPEEPGPRTEKARAPAAAIVSPEPGPPAGDPLLPESSSPLPGPEDSAVAEAAPVKKPGNTGILAFREQLASLKQDKVTPRLGAEARYGDADDTRQGSSPSTLTSNAPASSGGVNLASLSRTLGGGGGGIGGGGGGALGGNGGGGGIPGGRGGGGGGLGVGRATSPIAPGGDRPLAHGGPGPSRTDEEIQIVFDRYKASFYRVYNRELRKNPALQGQMVLRLTIEPDGSVSMCKLQSSDMDAPDLANEVVNRVLTINFGAKEGVQALTIVYPIDFLPAS
ncbi:MAG TPA: AgmX/PglI C-terminal domain-containing protein [Candidatus Polarisedimenticolia bacterium]|jgi:hypothetical protein